MSKSGHNSGRLAGARLKLSPHQQRECCFLAGPLSMEADHIYKHNMGASMTLQ